MKEIKIILNNDGEDCLIKPFSVLIHITEMLMLPPKNCLQVIRLSILDKSEKQYPEVTVTFG